MNVKKLALSGVSVIAGVVMFLPAASVSAAPQAGLKPLIIGGNAAIDVQTELNCNYHNIEAVVTNKASEVVTPRFIVDQHEVNLPDMPIEPGKTNRFYLPYSGNNYNAHLQILVDTQPPLVLNPAIHCNEPVSFKVLHTSESMITGYLNNNSSFVGQTVFTRVNGEPKQVETLGPGESRLIAVAFEPLPGNIGDEFNNAALVLGTPDGYQGSYLIDLNRVPVLPPPPPVASKAE